MMDYIKYFISILILWQVAITKSQRISLEHPSERNRKDIIHKDTINKCPPYEIVNLSNLGLTDVTNTFVISEGIKSLSFEYNDLKRVPHEILNSVPNLECLNLASNRIPYAQLEIAHKNLKTLIFDNQRLSEVEELTDSCTELRVDNIALPSLENLSWRDAKASCLYLPFSSFPKLNTVDFSDSIFNIISNNATIEHVKNVYLKRNNIEEFNLDYFQNVETLYLDENPLKKLFSNTYNRKLKLLSLSGCSLEEVPPELYSDSLVALDLSHNEITTTNGAFNSIPNIENLDLSYNKLNTIPTFDPLYRLRKLSLSNNLITQITYNIRIPHLKVLSLKSNKITYISSTAFVMLKELQELDLSCNELTSLPPKWHEGTTGLRYLNLERNQFLTISDMSVDTISSLRELYVEGNGIKTIDIYELRKIPSECVLYVL